MSELNEKSIALANSIRKTDERAVIVFADVFEHDDEENYELMNAARDINAICLKRDVTHLNIIKKKGDVEIFLIGENESENVSQAVQLTTELNEKNKKHNVKIFVFQQSQVLHTLLTQLSMKNCWSMLLSITAMIIASSCAEWTKFST